MLDLEEAAIAHVATLDPDLPVARLLAPRATFDGHQVRLFERLHGHKAGPELDEAALREVAAVHARLCLALRSFFHPAAGRELLWNLHAAPRLRPLLAEIADPTRRALVARVARSLRGARAATVGTPTRPGRARRLQPRQSPAGRAWPSRRDPRFRRLLPHGARGRRRRRPRVVPAWTADRGCLPDRPDRARRLHVALPARAARARAARRPGGSAARGDRLDQRVALPPLPRQRRVYRGLGRRLLAPARAARQPRSGGCRTGARRATRPCSEPGARTAAERSARRAADAAHLRAPRPRGPRRGRLDLRAGRKPAPRRLQQRPGRRALPPAGDRGGRPPDAARRDQREVPRRAAGRARRAVARHIPAGRGPRHGAARQLGQRGERPRLAARSRSDGTRRRARDGERVPRRHCRDDSALPRGLAGGAPAGRRSPHSRPRERRRPRRRVGRRARGAGRRARRDVPRRVAHERRDPRARDLRAPAARGADARRGRALRRGRGAGGPRPARAGALVVRAARHRTGRRDARQADGQRLPGRRGRDPARARRAVSVRGADVLDLRRQSGGRRRRARRARRARGRAAPRARCRRRRAPAYGRRDAPQAGRRRGARPGPPRRHPALEQRAGHSRHRGAARARDPRGTHGKARRRAQDPAAARVHG